MCVFFSSSFSFNHKNEMKTNLPFHRTFFKMLLYNTDRRSITWRDRSSAGQRSGRAGRPGRGSEAWASTTRWPPATYREKNQKDNYVCSQEITATRQRCATTILHSPLHQLRLKTTKFYLEHDNLVKRENRESELLSTVQQGSNIVLIINKLKWTTHHGSPSSPCSTSKRDAPLAMNVGRWQISFTQGNTKKGDDKRWTTL